MREASRFDAAGDRLDVGRKFTVLVALCGECAHDVMRIFDRLGGAQRPAEVDAFGGRPSVRSQ